MSWCETECTLVKQNNIMKLEVFILGRQRSDQQRKEGWGEGEEDLEMERKETKGN